MTSIAYSGIGSVACIYDGLGRFQGWVTTLNQNQVGQYYTFTPGVNGKTTALVQSVYSTLGVRGYYYDAAGRLTTETVQEAGGGFSSIVYGYDAAGQLINDETLHFGIPNSEHCEMDFYNNEMGRLIAQELKEQGNATESDIISAVYQYAMSDDAYYRIDERGSIRTIRESRPASFEDIMRTLRH